MPWTCPSCTLVNEDSDRVCTACGRGVNPVVFDKAPNKDRPLSKDSYEAGWRIQVQKNKLSLILTGFNTMITCPVCKIENNMGNLNCIECGTQIMLRGVPAPVAKGWACPTCTFINQAETDRCIVCGTPKPGTGARGGSIRRKTKRRKYTKRRRACRTRCIKKQNRS